MTTMISHSASSQAKTNPVEQSSPSVWKAIAIGLNHFSSNIITFLTSGDEPRISQRADATGRIIWTIYDPRSNQHIICTSEAEVRAWLEYRY
jgi:hypothetical protein